MIADSVHVAQSLVYALLDVFDATKDLYQTLREKDKRDYEQSLRTRGYPSGRRIDYVDDDAPDSGGESLVMDKAAVTRQFEIGLDEIGSPFAVGDGKSISLSSFYHANSFDLLSLIQLRCLLGETLANCLC